MSTLRERAEHYEREYAISLREINQLREKIEKMENEHEKTIKLPDVKDLTNDELNELNKIMEEEITKRNNTMPEVIYYDKRDCNRYQLNYYEMHSDGECSFRDYKGHEVILNMEEMWKFYSFKKKHRDLD